MQRRNLIAALALTASAASLAVAGPAAAAPVNGLAGVFNKVSITYLPTSGACFDNVQGAGQCLSYSAVALQLAGATPGADVKVGGIDFAWPNTSSGQNDSMTPNGQTIKVSPPAGTNTLALLGASHNGPVSTEVDLTYSTPDSSGSYTSAEFVNAPDWWAITGSLGSPGQGAGPNELRTAFQMAGNAVPVPVAVSVYAMTVPVDPARQLVSVAFPGAVPSIAFFDLQLTKQ
jgi:hypothetical protein